MDTRSSSTSSFSSANGGLLDVEMALTCRRTVGAEWDCQILLPMAGAAAVEIFGENVLGMGSIRLEEIIPHAARQRHNAMMSRMLSAGFYAAEGSDELSDGWKHLLNRMLGREPGTPNRFIKVIKLGSDASEEVSTAVSIAFIPSDRCIQKEYYEFKVQLLSRRQVLGAERVVTHASRILHDVRKPIFTAKTGLDKVNIELGDVMGQMLAFLQAELASNQAQDAAARHEKLLALQSTLSASQQHLQSDIAFASECMDAAAGMLATTREDFVAMLNDRRGSDQSELVVMCDVFQDFLAIQARSYGLELIVSEHSNFSDLSVLSEPHVNRLYFYHNLESCQMSAAAYNAMTSLILNMLNNARKAHATNILIECTVGENANLICRVIDNGKGMSPQVQAGLFQHKKAQGGARSALASSPERVFADRGEGLVNAREAIRHEGGDATVEWSRTGVDEYKAVGASFHSLPHGTAFKLTIPVLSLQKQLSSDPAGVASHAAQPMSSQPTNEKPVMLLADDKLLNMMIMARTAGYGNRAAVKEVYNAGGGILPQQDDLGYAIIVAPNAERALTLCENANLSMVITDYNMPPGMKGDGLIIELDRRSRGITLQFVLFTGSSQNEIDVVRAKLNALGLEDVTYVGKGDSLKDAVAQLLEKANVKHKDVSRFTMTGCGK